jgi:Protein of unknown function (DUF2911)
MRLRFTHVAALLAASSLAYAQSPRGTAATTVDGKKVSLEYGRPSLKGRKLDDLLKQLPSDRIWRAGDDQVTTLTTETDLIIGGKKIPAGKYSVYVYLPEDGSRHLVINKDLGIPLVKIWDKAPANLAQEPWPRLDGYQKNVADKEVARIPLTKETVSAPVETFTIDTAPGKEGALLKLSWGNESWSSQLKPAK